jgi:hypothetical protein
MNYNWFIALPRSFKIFFFFRDLLYLVGKVFFVFQYFNWKWNDYFSEWTQITVTSFVHFSAFCWCSDPVSCTFLHFAWCSQPVSCIFLHFAWCSHPVSCIFLHFVGVLIQFPAFFCISLSVLFQFRALFCISLGVPFSATRSLQIF